MSYARCRGFAQFTHPNHQTTQSQQSISQILSLQSLELLKIVHFAKAIQFQSWSQSHHHHFSSHRRIRFSRNFSNSAKVSHFRNFESNPHFLPFFFYSFIIIFIVVFGFDLHHFLWSYSDPSHPKLLNSANCNSSLLVSSDLFLTLFELYMRWSSYVVNLDTVYVHLELVLKSLVLVEMFWLSCLLIKIGACLQNLLIFLVCEFEMMMWVRSELGRWRGLCSLLPWKDSRLSSLMQERFWPSLSWKCASRFCLL